jgi:hypothetical protein
MNRTTKRDYQQYDLRVQDSPYASETCHTLRFSRLLLLPAESWVGSTSVKTEASNALDNIYHAADLDRPASILHDL